MAKRGGENGSRKGAEAQERRQRLASALRDNLARRKAQARARSGIRDRSKADKDDTVSGRNGEG